MSSSIKRYLGPVVLAAVVAGCGPATLPAPDITGTGQPQGKPFKTAPSPAGLPVTPNTDATEFSKLVASNSGRFTGRTDPFALTGFEKSYESEQSASRVFSQSGFSTMVEPKDEVAPPIVLEPQPYRRLSGVVVGDSVLAIIDMGNGGDPVLIHPGDHIEGTDWTVVSIDPDKAVLRRSGNVLPKEIVVRLEVAAHGTTLPGGQGFGGPGGPPGGFPGGPGGGAGRRFGPPGGGRFPGAGGGK